MKWIKKIPLKFKLLILLVFVTSISTIVYSRLALSGFEEDKIVYVFDSSRAHAQAVATQLRSELEFASSKVQFYMRGYDANTSTFHPYSKAVLKSDSLVKELWSYHFDIKSSAYVEKSHLSSNIDNKNTNEEIKGLVPQLINSALESSIGLSYLKSSPGYWLISHKYNQPKPYNPIVVIGLLNKGNFLDFFFSSQMQDTYLIEQKNSVAIKPEKSSYNLSFDSLKSALNYLALPENLQSTVHIWSEKVDEKDSIKKDWLVASSPVGVGDLKVITFVPKEAALSTLKLIEIKSTLFLLLIIALACMISVLAAHHLTSALKRLFEATQKISQGDFNVEIPVQSEDEVGGLTRGFNKMTQEILRLLSETAEKARMEGELKTAQTVQSTLFPKTEFTNGPIQIKGFYEPASECGGDWWYYNKIGSKTYLWIGDATGHGVPAALVTSAARSAARILEELTDIPLNKAMNLLNKAINGTSHGTVNMTFFLGCFDEDTQILSYCNASHDPPFVIQKKEDAKLKKSDIIPLMEAHGRRLGESADSEYNVAEIKLNSGDKIVLYTDGVTELKNSDGELLGERKFIKSLINSFNESSKLDHAMKDLSSVIDQHRNQAPLEDDVTYFMFEFQKSA